MSTMTSTRTLSPATPQAVSHMGLFEVTPDVACLQTMIANVAFVGAPGGDDWVLIDAGVFGTAARIRAAAAERYGDNSRPRAILLTHGHFDHVGALPDLADEWGVPIYAHRLEMPYLTGRSAYPPPDPTVGGGMMARLCKLYPRGPYQFGHRMRELPEDGTVPHLPGWRWIHTPGHCPGHVSFFRDTDRTLIVGDAFVTTKQESMLSVLTQHQAVYGPPRYYTQDWVAAAQSVRTLAALEPSVALTGHGVPMRGERLQRELEALAMNFEQTARPRHGRYVHTPALADERGTLWVPPPVLDPMPAAVIGGVALAGLLVALNRRRRED